MNIDNSLNVKEAVNKAYQFQEDYNLFVTILEPTKTNQDGLLKNIPYAIKDNIVTKDILTTASSNTLKDYMPIFDATVIQKLNAEGAVKIGKTVLDELGMGGTGLTGHTGIVKNPLDIERITGGSSAGSAGAVCAKIVPFSLGSDTGDSIRKPASYCGIVGYKPSYGLISRYGLIPFASSLDHLGVFTNSVKDAALITNIIKGQDKLDMTSLNSEKINLVIDLENKPKKKKLFYIKELVDLEYYNNPTDELKEILTDFHSLINKLLKSNYEITGINIDMNILKSLKPAYDTISCAEAVSNNSNLTGIIFGPRDESGDYLEMMINYRTNGFSPLIKRRFIIGSYVLQKENKNKYYLNACRVRRLITDIIKENFLEHGILIMPAAGSIAPKITDVNNNLIETNPIENHLLIGNFGGFPSITIPAFKVNKMPVGINLTADFFKDQELLNLTYDIEQIISWEEF